MTYRDGKAALEHQIKLLEQEVGPMRDELRDLDEQRAFLQQEMERRRRELRLRQLYALLIGRRR